jgi:hypothetical protein
MTQLLDEAADALGRRVFFTRFSARYEAFRADSRTWAEVEAERAAETRAPAALPRHYRCHERLRSHGSTAPNATSDQPTIVPRTAELAGMASSRRMPSICGVNRDACGVDIDASRFEVVGQRTISWAGQPRRECTPFCLAEAAATMARSVGHDELRKGAGGALARRPLQELELCLGAVGGARRQIRERHPRDLVVHGRRRR